MTWPGSPGAAQGGPNFPWGESMALNVRAALLSGRGWHLGPHEACRLDDGNVLGPTDTPDGRMWVDLACDTVNLEISDTSTTGAGVVSRDEAATCVLELYDPTRQYDPANTSSPYWLKGRSRLQAGTPLEITAEVLDGSTVEEFKLFMGKVDTWASDIQQRPTDRRAKVTASGAIKHAVEMDFGPEPTPIGAGDTPTMRIDRILDHFGWPGTITQYGPTSSVTLTATDFDGSMWEQVSDVADAEIGFVRLLPSGDAELFTREYFLGPLPDPYLVLGCSPDVEAKDIATDLRLAAIDDQLRNAVYASRESAGTGDTPLVQTARNDTSISRHGGRESVFRKSGLPLRTDAETATWAQWIVVLFSFPEPAPRTVELLPARLGEFTGEMWRSVLGLRILHDVLRVIWSPEGSAALDTSSWVMGVRHQITPLDWRVQFDLLPADRSLQAVWTIGTHPNDRLNDGNVMGWTRTAPLKNGRATLASTGTLTAAGGVIDTTAIPPGAASASLSSGGTLTAAGGLAPFDPVGMVTASCGLLVRTDSGGTSTPTGGVWATLEDESGNNRDFTQSTTGSRPASTRTLNGFPVADFDGTNDFMTTAAFTQNLPFTFVLVTCADTTTVDYQTMGGNTASQAAFLNSSGGRWQLQGIGQAFNVSNDDTAWHVIVAIFATGAATKLWVDGELKGTVTVTPANLTGGIRIGSTPASTFFLNGGIAVASVYAGAMSDADRNYLEAGWGRTFGITVI